MNHYPTLLVWICLAVGGFVYYIGYNFSMSCRNVTASYESVVLHTHRMKKFAVLRF